MTTLELETVIETAIGVVPFDPPVTVAFCTTVRDELRKALPEGASLDVYHQHTKLVAEARVNTTVARLVLPLV